VAFIEEESKSKFSGSRYFPFLQDRKAREREWEGGGH